MRSKKRTKMNKFVVIIIALIAAAAGAILVILTKKAGEIADNIDYDEMYGHYGEDDNKDDQSDIKSDDVW